MDQIYTTNGYVDPSILEKKVIVSDEPQAHITATEYWLEGELVRRDVDIALKGREIALEMANLS